MIPDLTVLQAFEAAARHSNFTKAAAELNLTQSAISRQIQTLEEQLGVHLFERVRKRVVLSTAGRQILSSARRLLAQSEELVIRARASAGGDTVLCVATLPTFGNRWLVPRLPDFIALNPGTTVEISSRSQPFDLLAENIDLAIHYGQPIWAHATCTYLCSEVILPVAAPALLRERVITQPEDIAQRPLLHLTTRPKLWAEWFQLQGLFWQQAYRGHRFDQFSMIIEAAVRGLGFALLPLYLIEDEIASGSLVVAFQREMPTQNGYFVVLPEGKQENPSAIAFRDWMMSQVTPANRST